MDFFDDYYNPVPLAGFLASILPELARMFEPGLVQGDKLWMKRWKGRGRRELLPPWIERQGQQYLLRDGEGMWLDSLPPARFPRFFPGPTNQGSRKI